MDNTDIVRAVVLAQNTGDDETLRARLHPDIEWHTLQPGGESSVLRGAETLIAGVAEGRRQEGSFRITLHEIEAAGDDVLVIGSVTGERGLRMPRAWIFRVEEGRLIKLETFTGRVPAMREWEQRRG